MKLISMKTPKRKTLRGVSKAMKETAVDEPVYPWGLEVELNEDSLKKLDLDVENMSAGDSVFFMAQAKVIRISLNENIDSPTGKKNVNSSVSLQIEKMSWGNSNID